MGRDYFDPTPEEQMDVLVDSTTTRRAEKLIESCEYCNPDAEIPFDWILDYVTGTDSAVSNYILEQPVKCPKCRREVLERTLIGPA
jgi:hypothetical protein